MTATGLIDQLAGALRAALEDLNINVTLHIVLEDEGGQVQQRFDDVLRRMLATPPNRSQTSPTAPADSVPGARDDNKPEPACGGAGNGNEESKREASSQPADGRADPRAHEKSPPPAAGGGGDDLTERLRDHMVSNDVSMNHVSEGAGIAWATVRKVLQRESVSLETQQKLRAWLDEQEGDDDYEPNDDPETIGNLPHQPTPRQAAAYLQKTLAHWMRSEGLNHDAAAERLSIPKRMLLNTLQVKLPTENVLRLIVLAVPELKPDLPALLRAKRMETNGVARSA